MTRGENVFNDFDTCFNSPTNPVLQAFVLNYEDSYLRVAAHFPPDRAPDEQNPSCYFFLFFLTGSNDKKANCIFCMLTSWAIL
jgi:hypothetical protein